MAISGSIWDLGEDLHGSVDTVVPDGSLGDVIHGVFHLPSALLYLVADLVWGFGS